MKPQFLQNATRELKVEMILGSGYGCFCAWLIIVFQAAGRPSVFSPGFDHYIVLYAAFALVLVLSFFFSKHFLAVLEKNSASYVIVAVMALSSSSPLVSSPADMIVGPLLANACAAISGICGALFLQIWAITFSKLPSKQITAANLFSYFFNSLLVLMLFSLGIFSTAAIMMVSPCVSLLLLEIGKKQRVSQFANQQLKIDIQDDSAIDALQLHRDYRFLAFLIGSFLIFGSTELIRYVYSTEIAMPEWILAYGSNGVAFFAAALLMIATLILKARFAIRIEYLYRLSYIALVVSALLMPFMALSPAATTLLICYSLSLVAYQCFNILNFVTTIIAGRKRHNIVRITGLAQATWCAGCTAGQFIGYQLTTNIPDFDFINMSACSAVVIGVLVVSFLFILTERTQIYLMRTPVLANRLSTAAVCQYIATKHTLSPRESELLTLLARGHNTQRIADDLSISKSTVNSHRYRIYKKIGIKSQQELIKLMETTKQTRR